MFKRHLHSINHLYSTKRYLHSLYSIMWATYSYAKEIRSSKNRFRIMLQLLFPGLWSHLPSTGQLRLAAMWMRALPWGVRHQECCPGWVGQSDGDRLRHSHIWPVLWEWCTFCKGPLTRCPHSCLMAGLSAPARGKMWAEFPTVWWWLSPWDGLLGLPEKRLLLKGNEVLAHSNPIHLIF